MSTIVENMERYTRERKRLCLLFDREEIDNIICNYNYESLPKYLRNAFEKTLLSVDKVTMNKARNKCRNANLISNIGQDYASENENFTTIAKKYNLSAWGACELFNDGLPFIDILLYEEACKRAGRKLKKKAISLSEDILRSLFQEYITTTSSIEKIEKMRGVPRNALKNYIRKLETLEPILYREYLYAKRTKETRYYKNEKATLAKKERIYNLIVCLRAGNTIEEICNKLKISERSFRKYLSEVKKGWHADVEALF